MVRENETLRIRKLLEQNPKGLTIEEVSQKLGMNRGTAAKYLNLLAASGQAEMRSLGPAKLFTLSRRVPISRLISFSSDQILILDDELFIRQVNDAFLRYFGFDRDELLNLQVHHSPFAHHLTGEYLDLLRTSLENDAPITEGEIILGESPGPLHLKILPLVFEQGERGAAVILTPLMGAGETLAEPVRPGGEGAGETARAAAGLVERIRSLEQERETTSASEEQCRALLKGIPVAVYTLNDEGLIISMTPAISGISGHHPDELIGHPLEEYVYRDDLIPYTQGLEKNRQGPESPFEFRLITREGGHRSVQASGRPVDPLEPEGAFQGVFIDIHEQKCIEKTLRQANRQLVLLNSITRHDILNGITKLQAYLDIAKRQTKSIVVAEVLEKQGGIISSIQRQIIFTRDYQNIGMRPPAWKDVRESVRTALLGLDPGRISVSCDLRDIEIFADDLLDRVFHNLVENSIQHGGDVTTIRFSAVKQGRSLLLICADDGIGIPDPEKELIFNHTRGGQTRYGLFFAREILAITGISIRENGTPGDGARFEISVPDGIFRGW